MTPTRRWRTAFATSIGTSHYKTGNPCQDAAGYRVVETADGTEVLVAAVSDGAGTALRSEIGSATAVEHFLEHFSRVAEAEPNLESIDQYLVAEWLKDLRNTMQLCAMVEGTELADYACTMLGAVVGPGTAAYIQIGDGAIVVAGEEHGDYGWVFWPQHGEYANSTYFVTQDSAEAKLQFEKAPAPREVAIFSDGIERLVLDMSSRTVHSPAFLPIFDWLAATEPDRSGSPSVALASYLQSEHINRRTDDDKALVMATRACPPDKR